MIVDSVAGSGKTTSVLYIAHTYPEHRILMLTYNARLKFETRSRATALCLGNIEVHTYHSFGVRYMARAVTQTWALSNSSTRGSFSEALHVRVTYSLSMSART